MPFTSDDYDLVITVAEYNRLMEVDRFMNALESAGVDNWEGYEIACQLYNGDITEDDI